MISLLAELTTQTIIIVSSVLGGVALLLAAIGVCLFVKKKSKSAQPTDEPNVATEPDTSVQVTEETVTDDTAPHSDTESTSDEPVEATNVELQQDQPTAFIQSTATPQEEPVAPLKNEPVAEAESSAPVRTVVRYKKSFLARLIQSNDATKRYFAETANYLLSYGFHKRFSWHYVTFRKGRQAVAKLSVRGKSLCINLALDPADYAESKYHVGVAQEKRYQDVPMFAWIRSDRAEKYAFKFIDDLATRFELTKGEASEFSASDYPYDTTENLLKRNLVKMEIVSGNGEGEIVSEFVHVDSVSVEQVETLMTDVEAKTHVETRHTEHVGGKKYIVNVDSLSANFNNGDIVDLQSLKAKKLVPDKCGAIKILARGTLDKALTVEADDFSLDAVKMIVLTGGKVIKLR